MDGGTRRARLGKRKAGGHGPQRIKAILFADMVGCSRLSEEQIPVFVRRFMEGPGRLLKAWPRRPEARATWGDALYFVFSSLSGTPPKSSGTSGSTSAGLLSPART